jgi:hypothetical protein
MGKRGCAPLLVLLGALGLVGVVRAEELCLPEFQAVGATFDLSPLSLKEDMNYHVMDSVDSEERNFTYVFNVCANAGRLPDPACSRPDGLLVPAYQLSMDGKCKRLSNDAKEANWDLIDDDNPSMGIQLTYVGGEHCHRADTDRSLTLQFVCADVLGFATQTDERVVEEYCNYELQVETVFGCPTQCPIGNDRRLCSGHGFCGMDTDAKAPRCFCNDGYGGDDCGTDVGEGEGGVTGVGALLIIVMILLVGMNGAGAFLYYRIRHMQWKRLYNLEDPEESQTVFSIGDEE